MPVPESPWRALLSGVSALAPCLAITLMLHAAFKIWPFPPSAPAAPRIERAEAA